MSKGRVIAWRINSKGCMICTSHSAIGRNYPKKRINGRLLSLHRYAYEARYGKVPKGMAVRHTCDTKSCINPAHLVIGTIADNNRDRKERGRNAVTIGIKNPCAILTERDVVKIFTSTERREVLAKRYAVSVSAINQIKCGHNWRHVTKKYRKALRRWTPNATRI